MHRLYRNLLARPLVSGECAFCTRPCDEHFCRERCQSHFAALQNHYPTFMALAGNEGVVVGGKRLLELDPADDDMWRQMPEDLVVALLEASFPRRETDARQFDALARFRRVSEWFAELIDTQIYARMTRLPRKIERKLDDTRLAPFVSLERLYLQSSTAVTREAVARLTRLERLSLEGDNHPVDVELMVTLPRLVRLKLHHYYGRGERYLMHQLATRLQSLTVSRGTWAVLSQYVRQRADAGVPAFPALRRLRLGRTMVMPPERLAMHTALETLILGQQRYEEDELIEHRQTDAGLSTLTNLTALTLHSRHQITSDSLSRLTRLQRLTMGNNWQIGDDALRTLTDMRELRLQAGSFPGLTDATLAVMPLLRVLEVDTDDIGMTNSGVAALGLVSLMIDYHFDDRALSPQLRELTLRYTKHVSREGLRRCTALQSLDLVWDNRLRPSAFMDAYEWLPTLRRLRVATGPSDGFDPDEVLYNVYTDTGKEKRRVQDHLPVGCYVEFDRRAFRIVGRVQGRAQIVELGEVDGQWHLR